MAMWILFLFNVSSLVCVQNGRQQRAFQQRKQKKENGKSTCSEKWKVLPDKQSIPHINLLDQNRRLASHLIT
jgi:hypothetical protein